MAKIKINFTGIFLVALFILVAILRLYKATDWFSFNYDEEYQAFLAWAQVLHPHPIWIGVSASNFGFYLGPAFTYLNAILFAISKGDLAILAAFSTLLGLLTTFSIYLVASKIFSQKAGIYSALIYGLSPLLNLYDRRFWNPTPIPFITIWFLFSIYKAEKDTRWYILTAAIMATVLHVHLSLFVFWPLVIFCLAKNFKKIKLGTWALSIITYGVIVSPLIVFDLVHNFDDLLGPIRYVFSPKDAQNILGISTVISHAISIYQSLGRLIFLRPGTTIQDEMQLGIHGNITYPNSLISFLSLIPILWILIKVRSNRKYILLLSSASMIALAYLFYSASNCQYFLLGFFTLYTVIVGILLSTLKTIQAYTVITAFALITSLSIVSIDQTKYGLNARKELIRLVQKNTSFSEIAIYSHNTNGNDYPTHAGWCYLLRSMGTVPVSCPADQYFGWIYSKEIRKNQPIYKVILSEDPNYIISGKNSIIVKSGTFTADIIPIKETK